MKNAVRVHEEMLEPYVCNEAYSSVMVMGDELAGEPCININCGTLQPHTRLGGGVHEKAEIYYVAHCQEGAQIVIGGKDGAEEKRYDVKQGDTFYIPGGVFHWIDNRSCDDVFKIMTIWPHQEQNEMYFVRKDAWGTSFRFKNEADAPKE